MTDMDFDDVFGALLPDVPSGTVLDPLCEPLTGATGRLQPDALIAANTVKATSAPHASDSATGNFWQSASQIAGATNPAQVFSLCI